MSGALTSGCRGALSYDFTSPNCERPAQLRNYGRYRLILSDLPKMRHHLVKPLLLSRPLPSDTGVHHRISAVVSPAPQGATRGDKFRIDPARKPGLDHPCMVDELPGSHTHCCSDAARCPSIHCANSEPPGGRRL